jgi:hypothetical protein
MHKLVSVLDMLEYQTPEYLTFEFLSQFMSSIWMVEPFKFLSSFGMVEDFALA